MLVCNFCKEEINPPENGWKAHLVVDQIGADQQPRERFDFHPECAGAWWTAAKETNGTRPT